MTHATTHSGRIGGKLPLPQMAAPFAEASASSTEGTTMSEEITRAITGGEEIKRSVTNTETYSYRVRPNRRIKVQAAAHIRETVFSWTSESVDVKLEGGRVVRVPHKQAGSYTSTATVGVSVVSYEHQKMDDGSWILIGVPEMENNGPNEVDYVRRCLKYSNGTDAAEGRIYLDGTRS